MRSRLHGGKNRFNFAKELGEQIRAYGESSETGSGLVTAKMQFAIT
jgi:hypothetical protein